MPDLALSLANLKGRNDGTNAAKALVDQLAAALSVQQVQNAQEIAAVVEQLQGVAGYRLTSAVDDRALAERTAGQGAVIDFLKAQPEATVEEAQAAWVEAAHAVRTDRTLLLHDPAGVLEEYQANSGTATWEEFRALVVATDKALLMRM